MKTGTKLGHYAILSLLGKGGLGQVWRARDMKLGREVAIKTLPEEFAKDADRLARIGVRDDCEGAARSIVGGSHLVEISAPPIALVGCDIKRR